MERTAANNNEDFFSMFRPASETLGRLPFIQGHVRLLAARSLNPLEDTLLLLAESYSEMWKEDSNSNSSVL